jgi:hypothetical protein
VTEHELQRELAYWRELLAKVADDIDQAASHDIDPKRQRWFASRARRIRLRLQGGVPSGWSQMTSAHRR